MSAPAKLQQAPLPLRPREYAPPELETALEQARRYETLADELHAAVRDAVAEVGHKEVASLMDIEGSTLSNLINCRDLGNGKRQQPPARLLLILGAKQKSGRLVAFLCREWGFAPPQKVDTLTPEEELRRLKDQLRSEGAFGQHVIEKALGRG